MTVMLTPRLTQKYVTCGVSPQPKFYCHITQLAKAAFRLFLQTTHPQRQVAGGLQKKLQAKAKSQDSKTSAGGGLDWVGGGKKIGIREETGGRDAT